ASSRLIARIVSFALLLEHFVELLLDRRGVLLERIVVDGEQVQLLERDLALRRRQVGARRIGAVSYHDSLDFVADQELGERLGGVRIGRALEHRDRARHREAAVARHDAGDLVPFLAQVERVGVEPAGRDQALAALEHVGELLIAGHHHGVVVAQLLVVVPAELFRERAHHRDLHGGERGIGDDELALVLGRREVAPALRQVDRRDQVGAHEQGDHVEPQRVVAALRVLGDVGDLVEALWLEGDKGVLGGERGGGGRVCGVEHVGEHAGGVLLLEEAAQDRAAAGAKQLDLDAALLLEQAGELLRQRDRQRRVPDDLALVLRRGEIDRIGGARRRGERQRGHERGDRGGARQAWHEAPFGPGRLYV